MFSQLHNSNFLPDLIAKKTLLLKLDLRIYLFNLK